MGVTVYVFDTHQRARAAILDGVTELVHHEKGHTLEAAIPARFQAVPGEYLGFRCVDNRWRLFCITDTETDDAKGVDYIDAIDAAVDDLKYINVQDARQEDVTAKQAVETLISSTEWALGEVTATDKTGTTDAEWESLWSALQTVETVLDVRVVPYYLIRDGTVVGKKIDVLSSERAFRGCFLEEKLSPANIKITRSNRPVTVMYGLGKATGTGEDAERLTLADAEWSKANGDPADKPKGQLWVEDTEATAIYGRREERVLLNDVEDANTLMDETWKALQEYTKPEVNVEATFHDLDQLGENEYKQVSIGDEAQVRTKRQELISTQIYDIDRDYVKPEQSKIKSGTETGTATSKIAGLIRSTLHTQETLTIYKNRFLEDEALIQLNANTILANAEKIRTQAQEIITIAGTVNAQEQLISGVKIEISALNQSYTILAGTVDQNTGQISGVIESVNGLDQRYTVMAGEIDAQGALIDGVVLNLDGQAGRITALGNEILLKASQAELDLANGRIDANAQSINLQAQDILTLQTGVGENTAGLAIANGQITALGEEILLKADKIDLQGLVTATELETVKASISNLISGLTTATIINAGTLNGGQINGTFGSFDTMTHNGALVSQRAITMGSLTTTGKALSTGGSLDLQHSHKVSVNDNGVLQLGEVSATGGNFNIADTQFYKNGVAAAANAVTLSKSWANGILTVKASNGKTSTAQLAKGTVNWDGDTASIPVLDGGGSTGYTITVDAYTRYKAGWNECRAAAGSKKCLTNYYAAGETLYDRDGNVAAGPWYKGTESTLYTLPSART